MEGAVFCIGGVTADSVTFDVFWGRTKWGPGTPCVVDISKTCLRHIGKSGRTIVECNKRFELLRGDVPLHIPHVANDVRESNAVNPIQSLIIDIAILVP